MRTVYIDWLGYGKITYFNLFFSVASPLTTDRKRTPWLKAVSYFHILTKFGWSRSIHLSKCTISADWCRFYNFASTGKKIMNIPVVS